MADVARLEAVPGRRCHPLGGGRLEPDLRPRDLHARHCQAGPAVAQRGRTAPLHDSGVRFISVDMPEANDLTDALADVWMGSAGFRRATLGPVTGASGFPAAGPLRRRHRAESPCGQSRRRCGGRGWRRPRSLVRWALRRAQGRGGRRALRRSRRGRRLAPRSAIPPGRRQVEQHRPEAALGMHQLPAPVGDHEQPRVARPTPKLTRHRRGGIVVFADREVPPVRRRLAMQEWPQRPAFDDMGGHRRRPRPR